MKQTMKRHFLRGILLSVSTALLWGVLPIFLKISLKALLPERLPGFVSH